MDAVLEEWASPIAPLWPKMPGNRIGDAVARLIARDGSRHGRTGHTHGNRNRGERADPLPPAWRITATGGANFPGFSPPVKSWRRPNQCQPEQSRVRIRTRQRI